MRFLYIYQYLGLGGTETQLRNRLEYLGSRAEVHLAFLQDVGGRGTFANHPNLHLLSTPGDIRRLVERNAFDVITVIDTPLAYEGLRGAADCPGLIINEVHTTLGSMDYLWDFHSEPPFDALVGPSDYQRRRMLYEYRFDGICPVFTVSNCLDLETFRFRQPARTADMGPILLWVGRLDEYKNWRDFLRIGAILQRRRKDCRFWIVGGGRAPKAAVDEVLATIGRYGLERNTTWIASMQYDHMPKVYSLARASGGCHVITSVEESFGMTAAEALACGCPVVASRAGALPEILDEEHGHCLFEVHDVESAADLVGRVLEDPGTRKPFLESGPAKVHARYSPEVAGKAYLEIVSTLQKIPPMPLPTAADKARPPAPRPTPRDTLPRERLSRAVRRMERSLDVALYQLQCHRSQLQDLYYGPAWAWALRLRRARYELLSGSWTDRKRFVKTFSSRIWNRVLRNRGMMVGPNEFVGAARAAPGEWLVVLFSGSSFVQEPLSHTFCHLAAALYSQGIPVLFSYVPAGNATPRPVHPLLYQCPIESLGAALRLLAEADLAGKQRVFVAGFPHYDCARWVGTLSALGWRSHYHCLDDWEAFAACGLAPWYDKALERYLAAACDIVTASAPASVSRLQGLASRDDIVMVPNAPCDALLSETIPLRLAPRSGKPIVGYFGELNEQYFDWGSLLHMAEQRRDWVFEIIGRGKPAELRLPANVHYLGPRDHEGIKRISRRWRCAFIPFKMGRLADAVDPLKVYEYLALGLPVVSFMMQPIADYPYVTCVASLDAFLKAVEDSMVMPIDAEPIARFLIANRWCHRVEAIRQLWGTPATGAASSCSLAEGGPDQ